MSQSNQNGLTPVYARREPTTDSTSLALGITGKFDVVVYRDEACTEQFARFSWYLTNRPTRAYRKVMLNCWYWALFWMPDLCDEQKKPAEAGLAVVLFPCPAS